MVYILIYPMPKTYAVHYCWVSGLSTPPRRFCFLSGVLVMSWCSLPWVIEPDAESQIGDAPLNAQHLVQIWKGLHCRYYLTSFSIQESPWGISSSLYACVCFSFAWPHISPTCDKVGPCVGIRRLKRLKCDAYHPFATPCPDLLMYFVSPQRKQDDKIFCIEENSHCWYLFWRSEKLGWIIRGVSRKREDSIRHQLYWYKKIPDANSIHFLIPHVFYLVSVCFFCLHLLPTPLPHPLGFAVQLDTLPECCHSPSSLWAHLHLHWDNDACQY